MRPRPCSAKWWSPSRPGGKRDGREPSPFYYAISSHLGDTWRLMGRYDEAEPYIREAPLHPWWSKGHWREFLYVGRIANLLRDQGHYERAKRLYEELLQNRRRFLNEKDLNIMREFGIMKEFGILYTLQGDFDAAAPLLQKALEGIQKEHGEEHHGSRQTTRLRWPSCARNRAATRTPRRCLRKA